VRSFVFSFNEDYNILLGMVCMHHIAYIPQHFSASCAQTWDSDWLIAQLQTSKLPSHILHSVWFH